MGRGRKGGEVGRGEGTTLENILQSPEPISRFERKVISSARLLDHPETQLHGHYSNTLGGMAGGGIFGNGKLVGLHLGGIAHANPPFNVFYPIIALLKGPLKSILK